MTAMPTADLSVKPYLVRAIYDWCVDNNLTPHMTARASPRNGVAPNYADLAADGAVTFNISGDAVRNILVNGDGAAFTARFGGVTREIRVDMADIAAIFARETGHGLRFPEISHHPAHPHPSPQSPHPSPSPARISSPDPASSSSAPSRPPRKRPNFRVV